MNIEVVESKLFAGAVADEIVAILTEAVAERGSASVALAGGSTPAAVYRALAIPPRVDSVPWASLRIYFGDERWVGHDDPLSNYRMASETLFSKLEHHSAFKAERQLFPVNTAAKSPELAAQSYESLIRKNERVEGGSLPEFDLVLLGMGEDGHTASLFPGCSPRGGAIAAVADHPLEPGKPGSTRVTLTAECLKNARRLLFMVTGPNKAEMLQRVLEGVSSEAELPARLWSSARGQVSWFVDSAAARNLSTAEGVRP